MTDSASPAAAVLGRVSDSLRAAYEGAEPILSYEQFMERVLRHPARLARNAAQYTLDALRHYGEHTVRDGAGEGTRLHAFDAPFDEGADPVVGNEATQAAFIRALEHFERERRINRLILVHGPNGSAKSSFVACVMRALEAYSQTDEGALYRFSWVFPTQQTESGRIGFDKRAGARDTTGSYAFLDERAIDAKLASEANDNPLFVLPRALRAQVLDEALAGSDFTLSDTIRRGDLSTRSRAVFDALLAAYRGDLSEVCRHVQVERFVISKRYRTGAVTVEPQLRVDASARQLTVDRSLNALPRVLQSQTLFESFGPLVEGNRGLVEYNDLLKRPMDLNKYLLATSEKGSVSLDTGDLHIDALLVATANESYLDAFKQSPDWPSYKARFTLIRMPYLLDYRAEQAIYDAQVAAMRLDQPLAPHTTFVAALWAVLTRLRRPEAASMPKPIQPVIAAMTPVAKALLYADGAVPAGLTGEQQQLVRQAVGALREAGAAGADYEGRFGASPREMKAVILDAVHGDGSPQAVFAGLKRLVADASVHEWLQLEPDGPYRRPEALIDAVRDVYLDLVEREVHDATGLVDAAEYRRVFERYVTHANHWLRKEKLVDDVTGRSIAADERFMEEVENTLGRQEDATSYRSRVISRIAAFRIDNPEAAVDLERIFPEHFARMRAHYHEMKRSALQRRQRDLVVYVDDAASLDADAAQGAAAMLETLRGRFGYTAASARAAVGWLLRERYERELTAPRVSG